MLINNNNKKSCVDSATTSVFKGKSDRSSVEENEAGNMEVYVYRNHKGLLGTGKFGGRFFFF